MSSEGGREGSRVGMEREERDKRMGRREDGNKGRDKEEF